MMASPLIRLMACSVFFGMVASVMIVIAVSVDSWQSYSFDPQTLLQINSTNVDYKILKLSDSAEFYKVVPANQLSSNSTENISFLYPTYTGLWRLCDDLSDWDRAKITVRATNPTKCFTFVTDYNEESGVFSKDAMQIARLQNSAASCYIVVIIDLVTAAVVGVIGISQKQVASCMVTGVLYCMAALFGVFGLAMFHTKDYYERVECYSVEPVATAVCPAKRVEIKWAITFAWIGVGVCIIASTLWLLVARALRVIKGKTML